MRIGTATLLLFFAVRSLEAQVSVKLLESFEADSSIQHWKLNSAEVSLSTEHATQGSCSARVVFQRKEAQGTWPRIALELGKNVFPERDWIAYEKLEFDIYNQSGHEIRLMAELRDSARSYSRKDFIIQPGELKTCEIPVAQLYREIPPAYLAREEKETPDTVKIVVLLLVPMQPEIEREIFLDNIRLAAEKIEIEEAGLQDDPFGGGKVTVNWRLNRAGRCDLGIYDGQGGLVARRTFYTEKLRWRWDNEKELVTAPPGRYSLRLTVTDFKWNPDAPLVREMGSFEILPEKKRPSTVAWPEPTTRKVMLDDRPSAGSKVLTWEEITTGKSASAPVRIEMASNEYEGAQVVFLARSQPVRLKFAIEALRHEKTGESFPLEGSGIYQVGYLKTKEPVFYDVDFTGWWPDALLPVEQMYAEPDECMPVWINLKSGAGTKPGIYRGRLSVWADSKKAGFIPLEVRVWDATLPTSTTIRTAFATFDNLIDEIYGGNPPQGMIRKYHEFVADHRLNPDNIYRSSPPDIEEVEYFNRRGQLNAFNLMYVGARIENRDRINSDAYLERLAAVLDPYVAELRKRGLTEKAYIYGFDEIGGEMYDMVKRTFAFLKKRYPEIPTMTTGRDASFGIESGLKDEVDIWVPLTPVYDLEKAKATRARGKEVWWYICIAPPHPFANWFIEYPAIEARLLWWMDYQQRVPGFLYYATNLRHHQNELMRLDGHNKTNWIPASWRTANGDGCFIYSGPEGPISTIRFENIRDGIEDTELLYLLEKKLGDKGAAGIGMCNELIKSLTDYTRDVEKFSQVRQRLLEQASR
jgi:hypothetical protein